MVSVVSEDQKASGAAHLIKMCLESASLRHSVFEKLYITILLSHDECMGNASFDPVLAKKITQKLSDYYITDQTPLIFERKYDPHVLVKSEAPILSKDTARMFRGIMMPLTLISDNLVIVHEYGKEPAVLVIERDPNAPGGVAECMPGGWVGPGDFDHRTYTLETAALKLDNEIKILKADGSRWYKPSDLLKYKGEAEIIEISDMARNINIHVDGIDRPLTARGVIPFFHKSAMPEANYDANMLNLLRVVKLNVKAGTRFEDATGYGRTPRLIPVSQFAQDRGIPMLPTVAFVRDKVLPVLNF